MSEEQPKRGELGKDSFVTTTQENELGALYITVPHKLLDKMDIIIKILRQFLFGISSTNTQK